MLYGTYQNWETESNYFAPNIITALSFLQNIDPNTLTPGKYTIDGDRIFALLQDVVTEPTHMRRFELHQQYIDIQLLITGNEQQLYAPKPNNETSLLEDSLAQTDVAFYATPHKYNTITLKPGDYVIYSPGELHCPCCIAENTEKIRKIVFKIQK